MSESAESEDALTPPARLSAPVSGESPAGGYASVPVPVQGGASQPRYPWKMLALAVLLAAMLAGLLYQQVQIGRLSEQLGEVSDDLRQHDVRSRLVAVEENLKQVDARLAYLDSKITAVDQKAQTSLSKWHEAENRGNVVTDLWKQVMRTFGFERP